MFLSVIDDYESTIHSIYFVGPTFANLSDSKYIPGKENIPKRHDDLNVTMKRNTVKPTKSSNLTILEINAKHTVIESILDDIKHKQIKELKKTKTGRVMGIAKLDDANNAAITNNTEKHGKVYTSTEELRYGHLMTMTDQDHDGSHIKGLLMEFVTPIAKYTRDSIKNSSLLCQNSQVGRKIMIMEPLKVIQDIECVLIDMTFNKKRADDRKNG
ncbi:type II DNA topoisomerase [Rhizophagus clarus]|uniref:DNA topoisomerase (ATP-hydrolyzing) n=1 Tax=Rhizophagus clarus TaxID=94130 RepID=A0A8H3LQN2_9GLOM|nr:type II DNA topoisomerase [Rhizophagus clarus]